MCIRDSPLAFLSALSLMVASALAGGPERCTWTDPVSGNFYDLSSLYKKDGYVVRKDESQDAEAQGVFAVQFFFNVCGNHPGSCRNTPSAAYAVLEVLGELTDACEILGYNEQNKFQLMDSDDPDVGVQLSYAGGDPCIDEKNPTSSGSRSINFRFECDESGNSDFVTLKNKKKCASEFRVLTPAGCPVRGFSLSRFLKSPSKILMFLIVTLALYLAAGTIFNMKTKGMQGAEAVPHIDMWRELPSHVREIVQTLCQKFKAGSDMVKNTGMGTATKLSLIHI
eukprot:TRINITY_DN6853_c0_g1_i1.p1 TRINITY_DN6853_c0_g1~~TRINITY_DN6853_c0_g1_i1.p1  ORF type:complete len:318 (+),score=62.39 TRINITY_DN6853_c0_g1_i1:110-955(+)